MNRIRFCLLALPVVLLVGTFQPVVAQRGSDEIDALVAKLLSHEDREFRAAGLEHVRNAKGGAAVTVGFAGQLAKLQPDGQVALLSALADRGDGAARPAVNDLLSSSANEEVRGAAIRALGKLGDASDVPLLIKLLGSKSPAEQAAARYSLTQITGANVTKALATEASSAAAGVKAALIEVLATRRAADQLPAFVAATTDDDAQVRTAAMNALGQIGGSEQIAAMLPGVLKAQKGGERDNAEKNIAAIASRIANEDERGTTLIAALNNVAVDQRDQYLSLVGRVGGKKLINYVGEIATGSDAARRKLGIDALSKWPDASVADKLLEITRKAADAAERRQSFQAFVKVCATRDKRNDKQRLDRMKQAMKEAKNAEEQSLVINRSRTAYDVEAMRFVLPFVEQPAFAQIACETIVELAHHRDVRDPHKAEFDKVLDKVIATSKDAMVIERAQRYKRGETWERPTKGN